ncbi:hypothetical protein [Pseudoalteromonas luteoviolacea]|uniref:Haloacid dehalogenase-like hydrolase n=1 Tax=Pseudoalteromonas luteoviolacea S4060-1 TaxID=1365257 RepID=A0A161Z274_9GAMM|nr:hypothetical protein [Pseudoalteromonas luteoviolacea]KZN70559.1 hypothetical protein N478_01225 [Pseudoalteromonas luteoviolacea S4060-1]
MIIGIDFDNTIADYTGVFYRVARELDWIPAEVGQSKAQVKAYFISQDQEPKWTELQGIVYGKEIGQARPYNHALSSLKTLQEQGHTLYLVSHKTRYPIIGDKIDFHQAAKTWLTHNGFVGTSDAPFEESSLFFNATLDEKVNKIDQLNCDAFVDDLEKVLTHPRFPQGCKGILFQPDMRQIERNQATNWREVTSLLC